MDEPSEQITVVDCKNLPKEYKYGCCTWRPSFLQGLNKGIWFCVFMSVANACQSVAAFGLIGTILSTLEKRFGFSSSEAGLISSSFEIATIPMAIIISFWGHNRHRPLLTGISMASMGIGTFLFALPHFITDDYVPSGTGDSENGLCRDRTGEDVCSINQNSADADAASGMYWLFIAARVLQGASSVSVSTLAVTYLDDSVSKERFGLFIAFFFVGGTVGPAIGYLGGGSSLALYTDFHSVDPEADLSLSKDDKRWVGAWWVGWLVGGAAVLAIALPFFGYPRKMSGCEEQQARKVKQIETHKAHKKLDKDEVSKDLSDISFRELPKILKSLITNPVFMLIILYNCCDMGIQAGFAAYGLKYVEEQFSIRSSYAGLLFGGIAIPAALGGTLLSGWLMSKFQLSVSGILKLLAGLSSGVVLFGSCFLIMCEGVSFAGVTRQYNNSHIQQGFELNAQCNLKCMCQDLVYDPICSTNNVRYYSPCHAGCASEDKDSYYDCLCLEPSPNGTSQAISDTCSSNSCDLMPLFCVLFFVALWLLMMCMPLIMTATLRVVLPSERGVALGLQFVFVRLFGTIPAPSAMGALFDASCELWQNNCDDRGACILYNNYKLGPYVAALTGGVKLFSVLLILLAWKLYKPPKETETVHTLKTISSTVNGNKQQAESSRDNLGYEKRNITTERTPTKHIRGQNVDIW